MKDTLLVLFISLFTLSSAFAQPKDKDALYIKDIHESVLSAGSSYENLRVLCKEAGGRLAGSDAYMKAVELTKAQLLTAGSDSVYTQKCKAIGWQRGTDATAFIKGSKQSLSVTTLGNTAGTDGQICGELVRFTSIDAVKELKDNVLEGKIAFFDRPFESSSVNTFSAYGGAVDQRVYGPEVSAIKGAKAAIIRSMTSLYNNIAHTGVSVFSEGQDPSPAAAISLDHADMLSKILDKETVELCLETHAKHLGEVDSYNVIGEIRGTISPDTVLLVGGHLDSWDTGEGAHDDGAGCVQSIEVLEVLTKLNYKPRYTIRCVLFANEESGLAGGKKYAEIAKQKGEFHLAALESDRGGFTPRGFTCDGNSTIFQEKFAALNAYEDVLTSYNLYIKKGGAGADISPLKDQNTLLIGYKPDSQRYFDYHHASNDTFEAVNERELKLGAAAMASLIYLIDQYGL